MPEETPSAASRPLKPEAIAAHLKFDAAYFAWLAARAASADPGGGDADEVRDAIFAAEREAEMKLLNTPAPVVWALLRKLEAVEHLVSEDTEAGTPPYPLVIVALGIIRADLLALGSRLGVEV